MAMPSPPVADAAGLVTDKVETFLARKFDYVIIGGGTAGLVMAARLSEDPHVEVAILEAGENRLTDPKILTPGLVSAMTGDPDYDWDFKSVPQTSMNNRTIGHPRGKVLGGSSAINYMMATYPSSGSVDIWGQLGNPGWDWATLGPYYRKFQTFTPPSNKTAQELNTNYIDPKIQGKTGPIQTSFYEFTGPFQTEWPETWATLNKSVTGDPLSGHATGGFNNPSTLDPKTATRSYAATGYYAPNAERRNLHLLTGAHVEKILFSGVKRQVSASGDKKHTPSATGVQFRRGNKTHTVKVRREVILSAGSIQSPQILELSGVGSPERLAKYKIPLVYSNGFVGENLQDHLLCGISHEIVPGAGSLDALRDPAVLMASIDAYTAAHTGPLAGGVSASAYLPLPALTGPDSIKALLAAHPDPTNVPAGLSDHYQIMRKFLSNPAEATAQYLVIPAQADGRKAADQKTVLQPTQDGEYASLFAVLEYPFSRGSVHIASADPQAAPALDPAYLSSPLDLEIYARHMLFLETLATTPPLSKLFKKDGRRIPATGPLSKKLTTVAQAKDYIKQMAMTEYHPVGTCKMAPRAKGGVVDERLRVHGVKNVRVVDASVFPAQLRGNTVSGVYAVAERAADLIKDDWARVAVQAAALGLALDVLVDNIANGTVAE